MPTKITDLAEYTTISTGSFVPVVDNNETVNSKNKKISIAELRKYYFTRNNSSSFTKHTPGFYYFGDNSDGPGNFSGSITTLRTRISASFNSTQDGSPVIKNFSSLFVSRSVVIKPTNRCRGMLIFVDGDAIISGSISMTARGAKLTGSEASFQVVNPPYLGDYWTSTLFPSSSYLSRVFAVGAAGAPAPTSTNPGNNGTAGVLGRSGGGGSGGYYDGGNVGGAGSAGTAFSGGSGGAGGSYYGSGGAGKAYGGAGGNMAGSPDGGGAGGAGNPGGSGSATGGEGTGGLLILIVRGNLKIGPNGSITTNGVQGGSTPNGSGGGGSGGGILYIYYGGTLTNNGTVTANGGAAGTDGISGGPGGAGGAGTVTISKIGSSFPIAN